MFPPGCWRSAPSPPRSSASSRKPPENGNSIGLPVHYRAIDQAMVCRKPLSTPALHMMPKSDGNPTSPGRRILAGLLGAPIAHSAAPAMHERAAEALDLRCHYQLVEIADASQEELKILL